MGFFRWLYPGLRIKRWVILCSFGIILCSMGFVLTVSEADERGGSLFVVIGICVVVMSIRKIVKSVVTVLVPVSEKSLLGLMYQRNVLESGPRIVAIGGGTGLSTLLKGLKERTSNLTAIVTVADDGGSSGRLRSQFNVLPPGDIRNCLVALADVDAETMMRDLFQFRFDEGNSDLSGHNFGNLFILAMTKITGDFDRAIQKSSKILNIRGSVLPSSFETVTLVAEHVDGERIEGETRIAGHPSPIERLFLKPADLKANKDAIEAIGNADAVVFGPGSLFTSILPNLLIPDIQEALIRTRVPKIYICNIMTQRHETLHLESDFSHVDSFVRMTQPEMLSHCVVNSGVVPQRLIESYREEGARPVRSEPQRIRALGYEVVKADLVMGQDVVRHNSRKLAKIVTDIANRRRNRNGRLGRSRSILPRFLTAAGRADWGRPRAEVEKHLARPPQ